MGIFDFLKSNTEIKGEIGYFGLTQWWLSGFNEQERNHILQTFQPLGGSGESLIKGEITSTSQTAIGLLSALAGWFNNEQDRTIAYRMLKKAEDLITDKTDILDLHFLFSSEIEIYYRHRNRDRDALNEAIKACKQQIKIAPQAASAFKKEYKDSPLPTHKGYEQLAIIEEKEKNFNSVIDLAKKAMAQGWNGDWEKRIERCTKKANQ
ncbi:TPA: hypothetical protein DEP34_02540 [Candidatus Uhrbacteria bacterium]|uniref:Uncharacterized protein n=2 Tax=Candidatus Uhriibacteriota TaxID=1752732 RepID=A0A0G1Q8G3_9BACT|nr:MAG: hypothetical protein UX45_C0019G0013 [Candidatus Uhrbacteria bacterium GW2011_GWF2_46_218]KKU41092.1 MAG: hypothetical protein UX57_C0006G0002 [Candidatus Uhrbacteria bacterium GW2011_GWE2_46_68]HBK34273.1 hypothetical protein [Candidatus Uhrbacteria bacterium]HCB19241.1 hypothetical protein [Candidatus Uhrbacteria bacterium]